MRSQGTELYFIDPDTDDVVAVGCTTSINGIDTSIEQLENTCLESPVRTYEPGLATPGAASFGINTDPDDDGHVRLHQLKVAGTTLQWALGWSDGTGIPPTDSNGEFNLPATRSWLTFEGFMNSFPFEFALNAIVASTIGIQISGEPVWTPKTTS